MTQTNKIWIPNRLFFRIGDVAELIGVKPHVLRYWESEFSIVAPQKSATGQRIYRRSDVENLLLIKHLLHEERYSIEGARKRIRELRKDGSFKAYKQEQFGITEVIPDDELPTVESEMSKAPAATVGDQARGGPSVRKSSTAVAASTPTPSKQERLQAILATARELHQLAQTPITRFFPV